MVCAQSVRLTVGVTLVATTVGAVARAQTTEGAVMVEMAEAMMAEAAVVIVVQTRAMKEVEGAT